MLCAVGFLPLAAFDSDIPCGCVSIMRESGGVSSGARCSLLNIAMIFPRASLWVPVNFCVRRGAALRGFPAANHRHCARSGHDSQAGVRGEHTSAPSSIIAAFHCAAYSSSLGMIFSARAISSFFMCGGGSSSPWRRARTRRIFVSSTVLRLR